MLNRGTNHCKLFQLPILLLVFLFSNACLGQSKFINVYVKVEKNNPIHAYIRHFTNELQQHKLDQSAQLKPFIDQYPLHITLYQTYYPKSAIPEIMKRVQRLAETQGPIPLKTGDFSVNDSAYLMLSVDNTPKLAGLSQKAVNALSDLRDVHGSVPSWAAGDPGRVRMVQRFGSPTVFGYFNPHLSILDPEGLSKQQRLRLSRQLAQVIHRFTAHHPQAKLAWGQTLGVGVTNAQGQIIKELGEFRVC